MAVRVEQLPRWLPNLLGGVAVALLPWALLLNFELPSRHLVRHWDVAWTGFDFVLAASLLATAVALRRGSDWLGRLATMTGTLLLCDAWFDVLTASTGTELGVAAILALAAELPVAALCFLLARDPSLSLRFIKGSG